MWIMNIVWPVTSLYFSGFALWAYFAKGRQMSKDAMQGMSKEETEQQKEKKKKQARKSPTWSMTMLSDSHCGAGCTPRIS